MISLQKSISFLLLFIVACQSPKSDSVESIIAKSIKAHGFDSPNVEVEFDFRDYHYRLVRKGDFFSYSRQTFKGDQKIVDIMSSEEPLSRFLNETSVSLQDSIQRLYANSLNSVMYFFQLPRPLLDPAVNSELLTSVNINGVPHWTLKITFAQKGGGEDFQDEYRYWINQEDYKIAYLAYNYKTDGGGTRFRKAQNRREINGILFQDYINYKPKEKFVPLDQLLNLYEDQELVQVSLIENKNIKVSTK